ncbi:MAG: hypothetical protein AAF654_03855 [Myxococcota bacterium]
MANVTPELKAQHAGRVTGMLMNGLVNRGDALVHIAQDEEPLQ